MLGYKCHENRLSGEISNVTASRLNQIEQETSFSQGILMLQVLVPTGIKWWSNFQVNIQKVSEKA